MLENSLLGKLYNFWQASYIYWIVAQIYHFFSNAFYFSGIRKFLVRKSLLQEWYENCLISKIIDAIIDFVIRIISVVANWLKPAWDNSVIVKLCKGSYIVKFDFILGAFVFFMYAIPHSYWSNFIAVAAAFGLLFVYLVLCAVGRRKVLYPKELGLPLLIFVALTFISLLYTTDFSNSLRVLIFFMAAFIFMWLFASNIDTKEKLHQILFWIYLVVIFTAIFAIGQRIMGIQPNPTFIDSELNPNIPGRVYSTVDNPNNYAELIVLFAPLAMVFAMNVKDTTKRFICTCLMALPAGALLMTYSRSGWLSIALTVFVFVYYTNKKLIPWIFVAACLALPFMPASIITRLGNLFNTSDTSANFRLELWGTCLGLLGMGNRWLTGIGLGPYTYSHNMLLVTTVKIAEGMPHTQMLYLDLVMQWGIFGFISFMWFIITKIVVGANHISKAEDKYVKGTLIAAVSSFLGIAILSVFEYIWFYPRILYAYFILLGIMIACINIARRENGKN